MKYFLICLLSCVAIDASAQSLQTPDEFLGYPLGSRFTRHHKVVDYYKYVAETMTNVKVVQYGETNEYRPLIVGIVTSQKNFDHLEEIRQNNLRLAGLMEGDASGESTAIVWLSYNVHGNESSSTEATMKTLYELANPNNANTQKWLENTVVISDPCINPDGRDRYANYYNQYGSKIPNPDLNAKEHREPWPGGRANHYLFDLNRDWAWVTQVESQQRIQLYNQWMPHVHVDFHEQSLNRPYYFPPAAQPYHEIITPWQTEFQQLIGQSHAKYFDEQGWVYFTKEVFDLFYPGYGDTYPTFNGAIGMTYEKGGGGLAGLAGLMQNGDTVTLYDRLLHHHTTGLSTVEVSSVNADRLVSEFGQYFQKASSSPSVKYNTYVVKGSNSRTKLKVMTAWLDKHQIRYGSGSSSKKLSGLNFGTLQNQSVTIQNGDILISSHQPKSNFVNALFEPNPRLIDSLTYDITAWAVPYIYGLEAYALSETINVTPQKGIPEENVKITNNKAYAYIGRYESLEDVKWLAWMLNNKIRVRTTEKPFSIGGQSYAAGTMVVLRWDNQHVDGFDTLIQEAATVFGKKTETTSTGLVDTGKDFGSGSYTLLNPPRVAVLAGNQVRSLDFGEVWYFFEQDIQYPVSVIDTDNFSHLDLSKYDVLVVPGGSYRIFNESKRKDLVNWIRNGGRLVIMSGALRSFTDTDQFALKKMEDEDEDEEIVRIKYEDSTRERISSSIRGAIYRVKMDNTHPLAFGYENEYQSLKLSGSRYAYLEDDWNVGIVESASDHLTGFVGSKLKSKLGETLVFGVEDMGRGSVVYLVDNPLFRAFWYNGKMIFGNAVFIR